MLYVESIQYGTSRYMTMNTVRGVIWDRKSKENGGFENFQRTISIFLVNFWNKPIYAKILPFVFGRKVVFSVEKRRTVFPEKEGSSISDKNEKAGISEGQKQEEYIFCYKGRGRLSREEYNLPLTEEAYETLIGKTEGRVIRKRRYAIPHGPYTVELDIFQGELEGLCYAEVEFSSEEEALSFQPLDWFSEELTGERGYSNAELSFAKELSNLKLKD